MTTEVNPTLGKIEDVIKKVAFDSVVKGALIYYGLDFWPVNLMISMITDKMWEFMREGFDVAAIKWINDGQKAAHDKSSVVLRIIAHDKGIDSEEFKKAKENAREAMDRFFTYNR